MVNPIPLLLIRSIEVFADVLLRASEMALNGAQLYRHGEKGVALKPVIITEVGEEPIIMLMTKKEFAELLTRPEVRNGKQKYAAVDTANQAARKAA